MTTTVNTELNAQFNAAHQAVVRIEFEIEKGSPG